VEYWRIIAQTLQDAFSCKKKVKKKVKCPNASCNNKINRAEQKKEEGNFYFCKDCGTVVYRRDKK